ncbi:MAG: ATP-binding protein [Flavobacteriales bacterium]|nr:ATP-binding protein [Flavobacteriales bacterium]
MTEDRVYIQKSSIGRKFLLFAFTIVVCLVSEGSISFYMKNEFKKSVLVSESLREGSEFSQRTLNDLDNLYIIIDRFLLDKGGDKYQDVVSKVNIAQGALNIRTIEQEKSVAKELPQFNEYLSNILLLLKEVQTWNIGQEKMMSAAYIGERSKSKVALHDILDKYRTDLQNLLGSLAKRIEANTEQTNKLQTNWLIANVIIETVAIGLFIIVTIYLYRAVMIPIRDLKMNTLKLSRGDLDFSDVKVEIKRNDEIGALSYAFNLMAKDLGNAVQKNQKLVVTEIIADQEKKKSDELKQLNDDLLEADRRIQETVMQLEASLQKEKELGDMKSRFVSIASHQFRTPLAIIQSNAELIKIIIKNENLEVSDRLNTSTARIDSEISRMTNLMNEVLIFGKVSSGQMELKRDMTDITELCTKLVNRYNEIQPDNRKMDVRSIGNSRQVSIDKGMMRHAIDNLISNAFKYSAETAPLFEISFLPKEIKISISDDGIGIPESEMENLFEPFHRAENVGDIAGTGLGLSIVKEYVELNGGTISVISRENEGTKFTIALYDTLS